MVFAKKEAETPKTLSTASVLVVDDQTFVRELVSRTLKIIGVANILTAQSAEDALYNLEKSPRLADVLILDYRLQGMNGRKFLETLRAHKNKTLREIPVVILTGHNDMELFQRMAAIGISGFLIKPVASEGLKAALEKALAGYRISRPRAMPTAVTVGKTRDLSGPVVEQPPSTPAPHKPVAKKTRLNFSV